MNGLSRSEIETLVEAHLAAVDVLIACLDRIDGCADAEPDADLEPEASEPDWGVPVWSEQNG